MMTRLRIAIIALTVVFPVAGFSQQVVPRDGADSTALAIAMYRTALRNGVGTAHAANAPMVVCVMGEKNDPSPAVIAALSDSTTLLVRAGSHCRRNVDFEHRDNTFVADTLTGRKGVQINIERLTFNANGSFSFDTLYWQHLLSSARWRCQGVRAATGWTVTACQLMSIS